MKKIWLYGYHYFSEDLADKNINNMSDIFHILGEDINVLL